VIQSPVDVLYAPYCDGNARWVHGDVLKI